MEEASIPITGIFIFAGSGGGPMEGSDDGLHYNVLGSNAARLSTNGNVCGIRLSPPPDGRRLSLHFRRSYELDTQDTMAGVAGLTMTGTQFWAVGSETLHFSGRAHLDGRGRRRIHSKASPMVTEHTLHGLPRVASCGRLSVGILRMAVPGRWLLLRQSSMPSQAFHPVHYHTAM